MNLLPSSKEETKEEIAINVIAVTTDCGVQKEDDELVPPELEESYYDSSSSTRSVGSVASSICSASKYPCSSPERSDDESCASFEKETHEKPNSIHNDDNDYDNNNVDDHKLDEQEKENIGDAVIAAPSFSVQGIYTRWYPSEEHAQRKSMRKGCIMPRRRLHTRPFEGFVSDRPSKPWTGFQCSSSNDESASEEEDNNEEDGEKEEEEGEEEEYDSEADETEDDEYTIPVDENGYDVARFIPGKGLVGGDFWHEYNKNSSKIIKDDRAILIQSQENYKFIMSNERFTSYFDDGSGGGVNNRYMDHPTFGEQVIVSGVESSNLAIGDVFEIEDKRASSLVIEITAPRKPCCYLNKKHGTSAGITGIQLFVHENCLAGWFARVLVEGELRDGMKLIRTAHPNPKWTLPYIYKALYWEGTSRRDLLMGSPSWNRSRDELEEMVNLPQLGEYEWKVEGRKLLMRMDGLDWKTIREDLIDPQSMDKKTSSSEEIAVVGKTATREPDLLKDCLFEYVCMTEAYQSMKDILIFLGITISN